MEEMDKEFIMNNPISEDKKDTIEYELNTAQCVKVALYMYQEWEKAMQPPLFCYYSFPDWLKRLEQSNA